jgi:hypothetical protein
MPEASNARQHACFDRCAVQGSAAKSAHRMVLSVRNRIHCGMGRFCFAFFASFILMRKVFCDGCSKAHTAPGQLG